MKTFYIFKLNKNYLDIAKKNPNNIYILLNSIYLHNKNDLYTAFNLFNEICMPINIEFFNEYFYRKLHSSEYYTKYRSTHMYHDYLNDEESKMIINKSHIKIKSNKDNNIFIINLEDINNLFICNFQNNYYYSSITKNKMK